jgi:hypothetical protein
MSRSEPFACSNVKFKEFYFRAFAEQFLAGQLLPANLIRMKLGLDSLLNIGDHLGEEGRRR